MIGIIGTGLMGKGIALEFAKFGFDVVMISPLKEEILDNVKIDLERASSRDTTLAELPSNLSLSHDYSKLNNCELIIEAVLEDLETKRDIFRIASQHISQKAVICTNTSSISIKDIFINIFSLDRVAGLHFFNPVSIMKLLELVWIDETSEETIKILTEYGKKLQKEVVKVKNSPGFIMNRLLFPMINDAAKIVESGFASAEDVDRAMKFGANHPIGPLKLSDLVGNDVTLAILEVLYGKNSPDIAQSIKNLVINGRLGRKTREGFYNYLK